jgi:enhancer of polycomb-like protein
MVTTSRRAGRVTNKTKLLIYRGSDKVDLGLAEVIVWENQHDGNPSSSDAASQPHHVGAIGVESNELLVSHVPSTTLFDACKHVSYACGGEMGA